MKVGKIKARDALLVAVSFVGIGVAASQFVRPSTVSASAECCTYSSDCSGTLICCNPSGGQANCSQSYAGYCAKSCNTY